MMNKEKFNTTHSRNLASHEAAKEVQEVLRREICFVAKRFNIPANELNFFIDEIYKVVHLYHRQIVDIEDGWVFEESIT